MHHVYLSPHFDDAVLSCGATIARQVAAGDHVAVLTVMAGTPSAAMLSAYAGELHAKAGNPEDMVATRRGEDEAACEVLGARPSYLAFLDAPYRFDPSSGAFLYTSDEQLLAGKIHAADLALVGELAAGIVEKMHGGRPVVYAPLGAGGHADHLMVRKAALRLQDDGFVVLFYEDFPYAEDGHSLVGALARSDECGFGWRAADLRHSEPEHVALKCQSIAQYASQIAVLFGDAAHMNERVLAYMTRVGGERPAERFWQAVLCPAGPDVGAARRSQSGRGEMS